MAEDTLAASIENTLALMTELPAAAPASPREPYLQELFRRLHESRNPSVRAEAEDLIWALWCSHEDEDASRSLQKAIGAMARHDLDEAESFLDRLVRNWPGWAEAWNKRATLYFLQGRDAQSVADIQRTLALEPRHFGAVSGFGQICLRAGDERSALLAFEVALHMNPNLASVREATELLRARVDRMVH